MAPADLASDPTTVGEDIDARLDRLRAGAAEKRDVAGWHFIEALARRAAECPLRCRAAILRRLARALDDHESRMARAAAAMHNAGFQPQAAKSLMMPLLEALNAPSNATTPDTPPLRQDLKAVRHFRRSWARLHTERQLAQALTQAPENAGPLNSQHLLLQAMTRLRGFSPDYLEAFIGYADALLWLEQAGATLEAAKKSPAKATAKASSKAPSRKPLQAGRATRAKTAPEAGS